MSSTLQRDRYPDEASAHTEATRRNKELGEQGVRDRYWLEGKRPSGEWVVEEHRVEPETPRAKWPVSDCTGHLANQYTYDPKPAGTRSSLGTTSTLLTQAASSPSESR